MRLQNAILRRVLPMTRPLRRQIQQSSEKKTGAEAATVDSGCELNKTINKNWISYGFDHKSYERDRNAMHSIMFMSITVCLVFGGFYLTYVPDFNLRDWSTREAFLQLKHREDCGLPLIDPNLIDPAKITLPNDEDVCDEDIII